MYLSHIMVRVNRNYSPKEHYIVGIHSGEAVFLGGGGDELLLVDYRDEFRASHEVLSQVTLKFHHTSRSEI